MNLSVIIVARDDKYGDDESIGIYKLNEKPLNNIGRIKFCLENNIKYLNKYFDNSYEYIVVDWSPLNGDYLRNNNELKHIFHNDRIKDFIVEPKVVQKMGLNPKGFYEYFGKNYGIRKSKGKYLLITNSDDFFNEELVKEIKMELSQNPKDFYYRPHSRLDTNDKLEVVEEGLSFNNDDIFGEIGTPAAGDFTLSDRENIINIGQGFNENTQIYFNPRYRQTSLDGDLIINMHINGIKPKKLKNSINSFVHNKEERFFYQYPKYQSYMNDKYWGELRPSILRRMKGITNSYMFSFIKLLKKFIKL